MNFIAALLILVHAVLAGAFEVPAPAPHGVTVSPAAPAPAAKAAAPSHGRAPTGGARGGVPPQRSASPVTVTPTCAADEDWDGVDCIHRQNPDEVIGRADTGPNGESCVVVDVDLHESCTPPPPVAP